MRVKWTEQISASFLETIYNWYPEANSIDFDKEYEGEVIGSNKSFWGGTNLVVACLDNNVREVCIDSVKVIKS